MASDMSEEAEILWDTWGVPHIFAQDEEALAYAFGWAQMHSHGDLILRLYAQARGRAAEVFGAEMLESDRYARTVGIPQRAAAWVEAQSIDFQRILDAFAGGMNDYAERHAHAISDDARAVLPISSVDVMGHTHRVIHFTFVTWASEAPLEFWSDWPGSNGWAIGPQHSASGNALLLGNPHLRWRDIYLFYEAHFNTPSFDFYGTALVGFPALGLGFNDRLGWTHTVNTYDGADLYELRLTDAGYLLDGDLREFETEGQIIAVREEDGSLRQAPDYPSLRSWPRRCGERRQSPGVARRRAGSAGHVGAVVGHDAGHRPEGVRGRAQAAARTYVQCDLR